MGFRFVFSFFCFAENSTDIINYASMHQFGHALVSDLNSYLLLVSMILRITMLIMLRLKTFNRNWRKVGLLPTRPGLELAPFLLANFLAALHFVFYLQGGGFAPHIGTVQNAM